MSEYTVEQDMIITAVTRKLVEEHERDAFPDPKDVHGPVEGPPSEALRSLECSFDNAYYDSRMDVDLKIGQVHHSNGTSHIQDYLGQEWTKLMYDLHDAPTVEIPDKFTVQLHRWQLRGAEQLHYLCHSRFMGGICGDEMGLGKTILAIVVMELARKERGSFCLVVCPASCRLQWKTEIMAVYKDGHEPKVLILDDATTTAQTIIAGKYDIVIVSYHFLSMSYRGIQNFPQKVAKFNAGTGPSPSRPVSALHAELWALSKMPIKLLVLDECHLLKKEDGVFYKAVQCLERRATIMLSGTVLSNRWADLANPVTLLGGHPFRTNREFIYAFAKMNTKIVNQYCQPDIISLQRFLLAIMIARPSSSLDLPEITMKDLCFKLSNDEEAQVTETTTKYLKARNALADQDRTVTRAGMVGTTVNVAALGHAVQAQQEAAHHLMAEYTKSKSWDELNAAEMDADIENTVAYLVERHSLESLKSRSHWLKHIKSTDKAKLMQSSRLQMFMKLIKYIKETWPDENVIVFSSYLRFLDIIALALKEELKIECLRYDGSMNKTEKQTAQVLLNRASRPTVMLITSGAGGVGLNLQCASIVIQTEIWWNENLERQAYARCYRQGQKKKVKVFRLYATNSAIDTSMRQCQETKTVLNTAVMSPVFRAVDIPFAQPGYTAKKSDITRQII